MDVNIFENGAIDMNDLRVESYDAKEVAYKKQSISKRMTVAGSAIVLTLGLFSLTGCDNDYIERGEEQTSQVEEQDSSIGPREIIPTPSLIPPLVFPPTPAPTPTPVPTPPPTPPPTLPPMPGGSGSWFVSVLERVV